jgi:acyl carrier protein
MDQNYRVVFDKIKDIVDEKLSVSPEEVEPLSSFLDDLRADSLDLVDLVMGIEEAFDLQIPDEDIQKMSTVDDAVKYVLDQQQQG